jgi:hypothetical protein
MAANVAVERERHDGNGDGALLAEQRFLMIPGKAPAIGVPRET